MVKLLLSDRSSAGSFTLGFGLLSPPTSQPYALDRRLGHALSKAYGFVSKATAMSL